MDKIVAIIPVHNRKETTLTCLKRLQNIKADRFELDIVIIDDGSKDGTSDAVNKLYPQVKILKGDGTLWWAGGVNMGFEYALDHRYDFVYALNDDIEIFPDTLNTLYETLKKYKNAVCSSVFLDRRGKVYYAGFKIKGVLKKIKRQAVNDEYGKYNKNKIHEADTLSSGSTLIPLFIIEDVGFFNKDKFPHNYSDTEYFIRIKNAGYQLIVNWESRVYTKGSGSNYHVLLIENSFKKVCKTFVDVKYANNFKTLYYSSIDGKNVIYDSLIFIYKLFPYCTWLMLKIILPAKILHKILVISKRIER